MRGYKKHFIISSLIFCTVFLVTIPVTAQAYTYQKDLQVDDICSQQNGIEDITGCLKQIADQAVVAVATNGYFIYAWQIPLTDGQCSLYQPTTWSIDTLWLTGEEKYNDWQMLKQGLTAALPSNIFAVLLDTPAVKVVKVAANPSAQGISNFLVPTFGKAKVTATYKCPDDPKNNNDDSSSGGGVGTDPDPQCKKILFCADWDGDGLGFAHNQWPLLPVESCGWPAKVVYKFPGQGSGDGPKKVKVFDYVANCDDKCPDNKEPYKKWYWDGDHDYKGANSVLSGLSCGPPANKKNSKGQWVNEAGDDCDDLNGVFKKQTWYWDQDKDNSGDPASAQTVCVKPKDKTNKSPWKEGRWILVGGDMCDEDPGNITKKYWYFDGDFDGFGSETSLFGCNPGLPSPGGQWVTKNGDACDDNKIPAHKGTQKKQDYFLDNDGDGVPGTAKKVKQFCSDDEAKKEKYVPKAFKKRTRTLEGGGMIRISDPQTSGPGQYAGETSQELWDQCDNNKEFTEWLVLYNDKDKDGFGSGEPMHLCKKPSSDALISKEGGDCDDNDADTVNYFIVHRDADSDGFGDPLITKKVTCTNAEQDLLNDYKTGKVDGWTLEPNDLSDIISADHNMLYNLQKSSTKYFLLENDDEYQACYYDHSIDMVTCIGQYASAIFATFCPFESSPPVIRTADLGSIPATTTSLWSLRRSVIICLNKIIPDNNQAIILQSPTTKLVLTRFIPLGSRILPLEGAIFSALDFSVTVPVGLPSISMNEPRMQLLLPFVTTDLKTIPGPFPVRYIGNEYKRSIVMNGVLGPSFEINPPPADYTAPPIPDLMYKPWISITEGAAEKMAMNADSDMDGLPDSIEIPLELDPENTDTDGDGYDDMLEFMRGDKDTGLALAPGLAPEPVTGIVDEDVTYQVVPKILSPEEQVILGMAKNKAMDLAGATLARMMELYDVDMDITINPDQELMKLLIANAQPVHLWTIFDPSYWSHPFYPVGRNFYGISAGCGTDQNDICIDLDSIASDNSGQEAFFYELVDTLLHEALHNVIEINISDPNGNIEHDIIYDVLGGGEVSFCIGEHL